MKDIDTRSKLLFFSILIFLDRIVLVEKDLFFRFSLRLISFSATLALLIKFLKVVEDLNSSLKDLIEDLGLSSIEVVEGLDSIKAVEGLKALPSEAFLEASSETSLDLEALISDFISIL